MRNRKRILSVVLSAVMVCSCLNLPMSTEAASNQSNTGMTYKDTFTEDWENGLNRDKWDVEKYDDSFVEDFRVVDDPKGNKNEDGTINQVITFTRYGTWLVADEDFWPSKGLQAGEMASISFRLYLDNFYEKIGDPSNNQNSGIAFSYKSPMEYEGWQFGQWDSRNPERTGLMATKYSWNQSCLSSKLSGWNIDNGRWAEGFATDDWFDVTITYVGTSMIFSATDKNEMSYTSVAEAASILGGRFCIGNRLLSNINSENWGRLNATPQTEGVVYMDDISITFKQSTVDNDDTQLDVNAYYAGNTFLNPGDTLNITGEDLGSTVVKAQIKKIDTVVSGQVEDARYVDETTYDYKAKTATDWDAIPAVEGSLISDFEILQRSTVGIKMILPDGSVSGQEMYRQAGSYAVLLEAAEGGKDAVVIVNNPQVELLLHDDGDYATPNGWVKLGGYNLSVQNSAEKISVMIMDDRGQRTLLDNSQIEVDTEENNGVSNDYYLMVHFNHLAPGKYQIMVHNGYGGNYGWSRPFDFTVKAQAENEIWRAKGTFNVRDFGAVGDSKTNDTAAIMRAIDAAVQNGGGMVYFPSLSNGKAAGYRITQPLIVGENVSLVGDGGDKSYIFYHGFLDTEQQEYFISYEKNFEIADLQLVCQTNPFEQILKRSTKKDVEGGKVYIKNCYFLNDYTGVTSGSQSMCMQGYTDATAQAYVNAQWAGKNNAFIKGSTSIEETYITLDNSKITLVRACNSDLHIHAYAKYLYFTGTDMTDYGTEWNNFKGSICGVVEDCSVDYISGQTLYRNIENSDRTHNNRELFLCDGGLTKVGLRIQPLILTYSEEDYQNILESELEGLNAQKKEELLSDVKSYVSKHAGQTYRFLNYNPSKNGYLYITYGQGSGQIRKIDNLTKIGSYTYFTVDEPFAVTPNRSSEAAFSLTTGRKTFVNNATFSNGNLVGPYGAFADIVLDNITITNSTSGVEFIAAYSGLMWYATAKRICADNISYAHTSTIDTEPAGVVNKGQSVGNQFLGIRYSDSYVGEGGSLETKPSSGPKPIELSDLVYENIQFTSKTAGVNVGDSSFAEGVWLRNIKQLTEAGNVYSRISPYVSLSSIRAGMKAGRIWCGDIEADETRKVGDVNNDGLITQYDLTLLRKLLGEQLTAEELDSTYGKKTYATYSDVTKDGVVDVLDFHYLRAYIKGDDETMQAILDMELSAVTDSDSVNADYSKTEDTD